MSNDSASTTTGTPAERAARRRIGHAAPGESERSVGQLVADASNDISTIVRSEIQMAKAEVTKGISIGGKGAGLLAGAGFIALLGVIFLFHTLARVVAVWLPVWAGYLVVTVLLFVVAGILALIGIRALKKAKPKPERAIRNAQDTVTAIKSGAPSSPTSAADETVAGAKDAATTAK